LLFLFFVVAKLGVGVEVGVAEGIAVMTELFIGSDIGFVIGFGFGIGIGFGDGVLAMDGSFFFIFSSFLYKAFGVLSEKIGPYKESLRI